jgi:hypothetical protein
MSVAQYGLMGAAIAVAWFSVIAGFTLWGRERER